MAAPTAQDEVGLKRVVRFLKTLPRLVASYAWAPLSQSLEIYTDSDHAGCVRTRRSTLGGCVLWGGRYLKAWSKTMEVLALSSGESELGGLVKACAEGLGVQAGMKDFGFHLDLKVLSDLLRPLEWHAASDWEK